MFRILHPNEQRRGAIAAVEFEGEPHGAGVSFFHGNLEPGKGPRPHTHPYPETCIIHSGRAAMTIDGQAVVAGPGDIVVIGPETPHRFTAIGDDRLVAVCIHAADRFVIDWIQD
ncbi:MAG: cupin domain-containing protein [Rhodobacteraceae bacterium]|nr:cupin domain-containing protein [Paracoccaceae bacterium]